MGEFLRENDSLHMPKSRVPPLRMLQMTNSRLRNFRGVLCTVCVHSLR